MEFYSKSKPNLILPQIEKTVYKIVKKASTNTTISEKITDHIYNLYKMYVEEHKVITFIILAATVFLIYRYYKNIEDKEINKDKESFTSDNYDQQFVSQDLTQNPHPYQDQSQIKIQTDLVDSLRYDTQPHFDRLHSVRDQAQHVNYPPDPLPINLPNQGIVYKRSIYPEPNVSDGLYLNSPNYNYNNVYEQPTRSYYTGVYNTYDKAQDTTIQNPLGFRTDFNSSTGDFVRQMTDANSNNLTDYQTVLDNTYNELNRYSQL